MKLKRGLSLIQILMKIKKMHISYNKRQAEEKTVRLYKMSKRSEPFGDGEK